MSKATKGWAVVCSEGLIRAFYSGSRLYAKQEFMEDKGLPMKPYTACCEFDRLGYKCLPATVTITEEPK